MPKLESAYALTIAIVPYQPMISMIFCFISGPKGDFLRGHVSIFHQTSCFSTHGKELSLIGDCSYFLFQLEQLFFLHVTTTNLPVVRQQYRIEELHYPYSR